MISIFIFYFLIAGMFCYYQAIQLERDDLPEEEQDRVNEIRKEIFYHFGTINIYPLLYLIALLFGWALLPLSIIFAILEKRI